MAHLKRSIQISADRHSVWTAIAALEEVTTWNPNISAVEYDSPGEPGVGTIRTCHLTDGGHIDETISVWEPGSRLQFAIGSHGGIRSADMAMELVEAPDGTSVTAVADYHVAFGPLGPVIDRIAVKRQMSRMLDTALEGLKEHVEKEVKTRKEPS